MQNLCTINFSNFEPKSLCNYLENRIYLQVLSNIEITQKYVFELLQEDDSQTNDLLNSLVDIIFKEIRQLFTKDKLILFPHLISNNSTKINLEPTNEIHKRINRLLEKIRYLMNNYVAKPEWTSTHEICCNELFNLEQSILFIFYIKENYLWSKINQVPNHEVI